MVCDKKVSVIIPCYNIGQYIGRCVDSILSNTYSNLEVICVNDGSTDGTSTLLHEYSEKDPRVIVVDKKNGGGSFFQKCGNRDGNR
jgi:glycosyltransferase involved in cell wall biosynthesis